MKRLLVWAVCLAICLCAGAAAEESGPKIGILMPENAVGEAAAAAYWTENRCIEKGVDYLLAVTSGGEDALSQVGELYVWGAQVIVLYPAFDGADEAVAEAREYDIPCVSVERTAGGAFLAYADNYDAGVENAYYMAEQLEGAGCVAVLDAEGEAAAERMRGFDDTLSEISPDIEIVTSIEVPLDQKSARKAMETILTQQERVDGVYAADDILALGAYEAVTSARRKDVAVIVSSGGRQAWLKTMTGQDAVNLETVLRIPAVAREAVDMAFDLACGLSAETRRSVSGESVTADTAKSYLDSENPY